MHPFYQFRPTLKWERIDAGRQARTTCTTRAIIIIIWSTVWSFKWAWLHDASFPAVPFVPFRFLYLPFVGFSFVFFLVIFSPFYIIISATRLKYWRCSDHVSDATAYIGRPVREMQMCSVLLWMREHMNAFLWFFSVLFCHLFVLSFPHSYFVGLHVDYVFFPLRILIKFHSLQRPPSVSTRWDELCVRCGCGVTSCRPLLTSAVWYFLTGHTETVEENE